MASRARLIGTSFGAGLLLTAAQLGVGGGLGLLDWRTPASYDISLPWVAFIFAGATLGGVAAAKRRVAGSQALLAGGLPHPGALRTVLARVAVTAAAAVGSLAALPLVWMPVRAGIPGVANAAGTVVASAAGGVVVGMVFGLAALAAGPVAAGVAGSALWLWVAAIATAVVAAVQGGPSGARLGVIEARGSAPQWWSGPYAMIILYAALAFAVALVAARLGASRRQVALSGLVGPALLASAYAIAGSGGSVDPGTAAGSAVAGSLGPASTGSGGDVRIAALVAAVAGLIVSTAVAMHRTRPAAPAPLGAAVWPAEGSGSVVVTQPAVEATPTTAARRATTLDATPKKTPRKTAAKTGTKSAAAKAAPSKAAPSKAAPSKAAPSKAKSSPAKAKSAPAVPAPRTRKAAEVAPEPVAETREERRLTPEPSAERLSRREREHVKWMETLLNTPPDPSLTTRRSSS